MGRSTNFISRDKVLEFDLEKFKRYCNSRKTAFYILNPKSVKSGFWWAECDNFTFEVTSRSLWGRFQPIYGLPSTKRPTKMVTKAWKWNWERYIGNELNLDSKMFQKLSKFKFLLILHREDYAQLNSDPHSTSRLPKYKVLLSSFDLLPSLEF